MKNSLNIRKIVQYGNKVAVTSSPFPAPDNRESGFFDFRQQFSPKLSASRYSLDVGKRLDNLKRSERDLKRLLENNPDMLTMITLTYAKNMTDVKKANKDFVRFVRKFRADFPAAKRLRAIEFQKRGAVHFHFVCDVPFPPKYNQLFASKYWSHGFCYISKAFKTKGKYSASERVAFYLAKYFTKEIADSRLLKHKSFVSSYNVKKPFTLSNVFAQLFYDFLNLSQKEPIYKIHLDNRFARDWDYKIYAIDT